VYINECKSDIYQLYAFMTNTKYTKAVGNVVLSENSNLVISFENFENYFITKFNTGQINKNILCKFDLDLDGKISLEDLKGILERYRNTSFFKRENKDDKLEINIFASEEMNLEKFKKIVKDMKSALKAKNFTEIGLFHKLDSNGDGFVSHAEFCKNIDIVLKLSPSIKDQFFNFLDIRSLGMVDLDTFLKRFKEFESDEIIVKNSWDVEKVILTQFTIWIQTNNKLTGEELFTILDKNCDGTVNIGDFKSFLIDKLNFSKNDFNDFQVERVLQQVSLTRGNSIGLVDLKDFIKKSKLNELKVNKKPYETNFESTMELNQNSKISDWLSDAIERLGMYISENFISIDKFFKTFAQQKTQDKLKLEDFQNFIKEHYKCFESLNLTSDEIVILYSALDSHKKTYITLEDLKNKLGVNFLNKMHFDVISFLRSNFTEGQQAFEYFKQDKSKNFLNKKELFEGLNNIFPNKYKTETILEYLTGRFKNADNVNYSEFNYVFYDEIKRETIMKKTDTINRIKSAKISSNRQNSDRGLSRPLSATRLNIATPFDNDPLEKIKRIINSSRFDFTTYFKMYDMLSENGFINQFEFKNMLKKLNIGLTGQEIDVIHNKSGKRRDGKINIKEFISYIKSE
jgi:Ca2+-binding EF-hand superfamily protein